MGTQQQREDNSITTDIELRKRDWEEPSFQEEQNPKDTEKIVKEKRGERAG